MNDTTSHYTRLAAALRHRLAVIQDRAFRDRDASAHLEALKSASLAIDEARQQLPSPVHPELAHFLARSSYDKALAWIDAVLKGENPGRELHTH